MIKLASIFPAPSGPRQWVGNIPVIFQEAGDHNKLREPMSKPLQTKIQAEHSNGILFDIGVLAE
jgi:hypothetical protein